METDRQAELLIVDDHRLILEGICRVVSGIPGVEVAHAVTSGMEAARLIEQSDFDLYILDVSIPEISGFELVERIRRRNPDARIILNTMHEEIWIVNRLVKLGVNAIILKSSESDDLVNAIHAVLSGESYTCKRFEAVCEKLQRSKALHDTGKELTSRELEVLKAIGKGLNTRETAALLHISENTVETYRRRLMEKFSAKNVVDLVLKAISKGYITP